MTTALHSSSGDRTLLVTYRRDQRYLNGRKTVEHEINGRVGSGIIYNVICAVSDFRQTLLLCLTVVISSS